MSVVQPDKTLYVFVPLTAALILWAAIDFSNYLVERQLLASEAMEGIRAASNAHGIVDAITRKVQARLSPVNHGVNFLRSTALESWVDGGGQCGDAARVIVLMLRSVGIEASRVYLRAEPESYFHVAVAYHVGGRSYLVDTVNSTREFRRFVETHRRHALDDIEMPNSQFYSYSYVNWGRLAPFIQVDHKSRLPSMAVLLMESPLLVLALLKAGVAVSLAFAEYRCRLLLPTRASDVYPFVRRGTRRTARAQRRNGDETLQPF